MSLTLNIPEEGEKFKEFHGRNVEQMPLLVSEGRTPLSVAGLMQRRLETIDASMEVKSSWMDNYFDTGDAFAYHPDGRVKIVLDSQTLREINPDSKRNSGALVIIPEQYDAMSGEEFKKGELGTLETSLSSIDVKLHPVWRALARDQALLNDYTDMIFSEAKQRFKHASNMDVYLGSAKGKTPEMRAVCVYWLVDWSLVYGKNNLGNDNGRFAGTAPKMQMSKR